MIRRYIAEAIRRATYELIDDAEPYFGRIRGCRGVWARGKTLEQCRENLEEVLDGWLYVRLSRGLAIPPLGKVRIRLAKRERSA